MRNLRICCLLLLILGLAMRVLAVDYTWNLDTNDGDWANPANWWDGSAYGTGVPSGAGDTATIVATVAGPPTNNIPASLTLGSLTVSTNWNSASLTAFTGNLIVDTSSSLTTGTDLVITGSLTINTAGSAVILGGTLSVSVNLTVNNGSFSSSDFAVTVGGNFINNAGAGGLALGSSTVTFNGTGDQTVTMGGATAPSAGFVVNKTAGTMTFSDALTVNSLTITNSGGVTVSGPLTAGTVTLTDTTGTIAFNSDVSITTGLSTAANGYNVSLNAGAGGQTSSIAGVTTFNNTGTLTLGNNAADSITFTGGVTATASSAVNTAGTVATGGGAGQDINFGDGDTGVVLTANTTLNAGAAGDITLGGTVSGAFSLTLNAGGGTVTVASTNGTPTGLTVTASIFTTTGSVTVAAGNPITVTSDQINLGNTFGNSGAGAITLQPAADATTIGLYDPVGTFNLTNTELGFLTTTGTVTIGRTTGTGAITVAGSGHVNLGGTTYDLLIEGNSSAVSFAANTLTLGDNRTLTFSNGGNITVTSGATHVSIGGTGTLIVSQAVNVGASGTPLDTNIAVIRASVTGNIFINEFDAVQLGNGGGGITTSGGQIEITAGGALTFGNTVTTTGAGTSISLTATAGGMVISQNIQAANNAQITLTAGGAGSITRPSSGTVGAGGSTSLLVLSAGGSIGASGAALATNVGTIRASAGGDIYISEASAVQLGDASGPVTTSNGVINITATGNLSTGVWAGGDIVSTSGGAGGITLITTAGGTMSISDTLASAEGGLITLTNAGALTLAANITARGGLVQNGAGAVSMGGTITTTGDAVNFQSAVSMTGPCTIDTTNSGGNAAGANITFQSTVSGAQTITLYGGTGGIITFTGAVGAPNLAGLTIISALSVVFSSTASFSGPVAINSNEINFNGGAGSFSGNNTLILAPLSAGQAIAIGGAADTGAGTLDLTATDIDALVDG
ncbi:MAG TPA: hypothetical protein PK074_05570, partial [Spirochaetales bacterium]|nr:hypothetical protein [Spirochaetales bacterium]